MIWNAPSLGIAIPTYNRPQSLVRLLDNLNHQLRVDMRVVSVCVVDDGSDVDLTGLFPEYQFNFKYIYRPRREDGLARVSSSRNIAVANTSGNVVVHLDDDLSCHERTLSEIQNYASLFSILGQKEWMWTSRISSSRDRLNNRHNYDRGPDGYWRDGVVAWQTATWNQCSTAGMIMPRKVWEDRGNLDEEFDGSIGACDQEFSLRAQKSGIPIYIAPLFFHVDDSETGSWRDIMIEKAGRHNDPLFDKKHPDRWKWAS